MTNLKEIARQYYLIGLNITTISTDRTSYNYHAKDRLKVPSSRWKHLWDERQTVDDFDSLCWERAVGVGFVTGYDDILVIDVDKCNNPSVINKMTSALKLPDNYEWVIVSGSTKGFHIVVRCEKFVELDDDVVVSTYYPNDSFEDFFEKVEFLWNTHAVLPPSIHSSGNRYRFFNSSNFPKLYPAVITRAILVNFINLFLDDESSFDGESYLEEEQEREYESQEVEADEDQAYSMDVAKITTKAVFSNIREAIVDNLHTAKSSVIVAVAWFTDLKIINELKTVLARGVSVRIIFYDDKVNDKKIFHGLSNAGAKIRCSKEMMHNKFCVIDSNVVINGSYNWTSNASENNIENIQITYNDRCLAESFVGEFERIFAKYKRTESFFKTTIELAEEYLSEKQYPLNYPCLLKVNRFYRKYGEQVTKKAYVYINSKEFLDEYYISNSHKSSLKELSVKQDICEYVNISGRIVEDGDFVYADSDRLLVEVKDGDSGYVYFVNNCWSDVSEKNKIERHIGNGFYLFKKDGRLLVLNNKMEIILLPYDCVNYDISVDEKYIYLKTSGRYGLADLSGRVMIPSIYSSLSIGEYGVVKCIEAPFFKKEIKEIDYVNLWGDDYPRKVKVYTLQYVEESDFDVSSEATYYILNNNVYNFHQESYNNNFVFLSEDNFKWMDAYLGIKKSIITGVGIKVLEDTKKYFRMHENVSPLEFRSKFIKLQSEYFDENRKMGEKAHEIRTKYTYASIDDLRKRHSSKRECYIATMIYGDVDDYRVVFLRDLRDRFLCKYSLGVRLVDFYYRYSPYWVEVLKGKLIVNLVIRLFLDFIVSLYSHIQNKKIK